MKQFTSIYDVADVTAMVASALEFKKFPLVKESLGKGKTIALIFLNPSLRTRLSTQKAAQNLGMSVISLSPDQGWKLEFEDGAIMDVDRAEHVKDAAAVISQYADIIAIRAFPGLTDREQDYGDHILHQFIRYARVPVISLESAIRHPLQSLADLITIREYQRVARPKVVLTWAPHPRPLPQAVANSFIEWMQHADVELVVTHPHGYELAPTFIKDTPVVYNQDEALAGAHFVYAKNWSAYEPYAQVLHRDASWMLTPQKMTLTDHGHFMHCLPVRRNVEVHDAVLDAPTSLILEQANNRTYAAQAVIAAMLKEGAL